MARRYTYPEELRLQLGNDDMIKLTSEETSKEMKTCVAGRAICPELATFIARLTHERRM